MFDKLILIIKLFLILALYNANVFGVGFPNWNPNEEKKKPWRFSRQPVGGWMGFQSQSFLQVNPGPGPVTGG
jgi:hypothetical protein